MKTIMVTTDYSATATNAVHYGACLAQVFNADLILFNVYNLSVHVRNALVGPDAIDHIIKNNEDRLNDLSEDITRRYQINVKPVIKSTNPVEAIEDYLSTQPVDLIVMGMDSDLPEYKIFGNTTTAAIRKLKYPVLVVPNDVLFEGVKRILYACEYTYLSKDNHLNLLNEIARKFGAELQVLHVETEIKEQTATKFGKQVRAVDAILKGTDHTYNLVENSDVGDGILQEAQAWRADLLVMVPHKTHLLELLLHGSATRRMAVRTRTPLLVLPNG